MTLDHKRGELRSKQETIVRGADRLHQLEGQVKEQKGLTEKAEKDLDLLRNRAVRIQQDLDEQRDQNTLYQGENSKKEEELKEKREKIAHLEERQRQAEK